MGVTIESKNYSGDMGYGGFNRFRNKVATLSNPKFGEHYARLDSTMFLIGDERKSFFEEYDTKTKELIKNDVVTAEIANFCYQPDSEGSIDQNQAKQIYEKIENYDDNIPYGYSGRSDCAMFSDLKNIFRDCAKNGGTIDWW